MIETVAARTTACLQQSGCRFMIGGSVATMFYSEPRSTLDINIVIQALPHQTERILASFPADTWYVSPADVISKELQRGSQGSFNVIDEETGIKIDLYPAGHDALILWGLDHAQQVPWETTSIPIAPREYLIVMKMRYFAISGQEKHLRDIRSLLHISRGQVDYDLVAEWSRKYGVHGTWQLLTGS